MKLRNYVTVKNAERKAFVLHMVLYSYSFFKDSFKRSSSCSSFFSSYLSAFSRLQLLSP